MNEEEKIFAGKMFDPRKTELKDIKHKLMRHAAVTMPWMNTIRNGLRFCAGLSAKWEEHVISRGLYSLTMGAIRISERISLPTSTLW